MRINIRIGGSRKQGFSILFFYNLANNNVYKPVNNKGLSKVASGVFGPTIFIVIDKPFNLHMNFLDILPYFFYLHL